MTPRAKFFKTGFNVCLAVYDTRRGQLEGAEGDKILGFYPPGTSINVQSSVVGLAQALTMFAGTFNEDERFHFMEAEGHRWIMHHCEPGIWLVMILNRAWLGSFCQPGTLMETASALHALFVLVHGSLTAMLQQDASAHTARCKLQPFLQDVAGRLVRPETREHAALACPLAAPYAAPQISISSSSFTAMQALVADLLVRVHYGSRVVAGVTLAWEGAGGGLLWSTLDKADTSALWQLATCALFPSLKAPRHAHVARQAPGAAPRSGTPLTSPYAWAAVTVEDGGDLSGVLLPVAASVGQPHVASEGGDARTSRPASVPDAGSLQLPCVWLMHGEDHCLLLPWHSGPLLVLVLLHGLSTAAGTAMPGLQHAVPAQANGTAGFDVNTAANGVLTGSSGVGTPPGDAVLTLVEVLRERGGPLATQLTAELPPLGLLGHVRGCRYLFEDAELGAARASPLGKVGTLAATSLGLVADVRTAADGFGRPQGMCATVDSGTCSSAASGDVEVCARGVNDAWVVGRATNDGRRLVAAVEGDKEGGLVAVTARVQDLCNSQFAGLFDGLS